jgi:ATP-binding cassette subfamily C protein
MKKIFILCKRYLLLYKWRLFVYIFISVAVGGSGLASPYIIGDFIDQLLAAEGMGFIYRYFALFAGINLVALGLGYVSGRLYVRLQTRLGFSLNRDFIQRLQRVPLKFIGRQDTAYLNQRINNDANALVIFCINIIQSVLVNGVIVGVALALMFYFHPLLAGILLAVAAVYFVLYTLYKKVLYRASFALQESQAGFFAKLHEQLFNVRFIKLHSLFGHFIGRLNHSFDVLLRAALRQQRAGYIFNGLDKVVMVAAQMVLLFFGGREIIAARLTIGQFIIISSYFNMMLGALRYFFGLGQTVQSNMVSYNRLQELAGVEAEPNGRLVLEEIKTIEAKNLSFAYNGNAVLSNLTLRFERGKIYIIKGQNGAGKSTLADILLGLQAGEYTGEILFNGIAMGELDMYALRSRLTGVSEQEPVMLADTLAYNINLDEEGRIHNNKTTMDGLAAMLGMEGLDLNAKTASGGEKQKISILRALLKDPHLLVLDEPTSALDAPSKARLKTHLHAIKRDKIIIIITHEEDFISNGDVIYL